MNSPGNEGAASVDALLEALAANPADDPIRLVDAGSYIAYAVGGAPLQFDPVGDEPPIPGTLLAQRRAAGRTVTDQEWVELLRTRLLELIDGGVDAEFLVRSLVHYVTVSYRQMADTGTADRNRAHRLGARRSAPSQQRPGPRAMTSGRRARERRAQLRKRHHLVPATYLRAWANERDMVQLFTIRSGGRFLTNVDNATVRSKFYMVTTPEGDESDMVEVAMSEVEAQVAGALRDARSGGWPLSAETRGLLANLIALQLGRSPHHRDGMVDGHRRVIELGKKVKAEIERARVEDPDRYQRLIEMQSPDDAERGIPLDEFEKLESRMALDSLAASASLVEPVARMTWSLIAASGTQFITGDHPVVHWPTPDSPPLCGIGLFTAARSTFPLSPHYCLELAVSEDPDQIPDGDSRTADRAEVARINAMTAGHAHTHVVTHPSINLEDALGPEDIPDE